MDFDFSPRTKKRSRRSCSPSWTSTSTRPSPRYEAEIEANTKAGKRWTPLKTIEDLKPKARAQGLWNLFLPPTAGGKGAQDNGRDFGLSNGDYAPLAEIKGRVPWSPEVFNCSAPDTGNMETIERYGSAELKRQWLDPLLDGRIRSRLSAMTEPAVASSGRDQHRVAHRAGLGQERRRVRHQRPQMVDERRRRSALQGLHLHGQDRPRRAAPFAAVDDRRACRDAWHHGAAAALGVRLRRRAARPHGSRLQRRCACRWATSCSAKAAASRSRRAASGPGRIPPLHAPRPAWRSVHSS